MRQKAKLQARKARSQAPNQQKKKTKATKGDSKKPAIRRSLQKQALSVKAPRVAAGEVKSAATQLSKTTRKLVDDLFLKIVGAKVLERAQELARDLRGRNRPPKGLLR